MAGFYKELLSEKIISCEKQIEKTPNGTVNQVKNESEIYLLESGCAFAELLAKQINSARTINKSLLLT